MIKQIIRLSYRPAQIILDKIRHRFYQRQMMSYTLNLQNKFNQHSTVKG